MRIAPETEVSWTSVAGNTYQPQWSPAPGDGVWTDLGSPSPASGSNQNAYDTTVARVYRVMETVPASGAVLVVSNAITTNPGFESGTNSWSLGSIHTVQASNSRTGLSALRSYIPGGAVGAQLLKEVPAIVPGKIYTLSFWAKQTSAGPSYVQQYKLEWVGSNGAVISIATGNWVNFSGGNAAYSKITTSALTAPANTATARIVFYFATGAVAGSNGDLWLDDVALEYQATTIGATPAQVLLAWALARGTSAVPKTASVARMKENLKALDVRLDAADVAP